MLKAGPRELGRDVAHAGRELAGEAAQEAHGRAAPRRPPRLHGLSDECGDGDHANEGDDRVTRDADAENGEEQINEEDGAIEGERAREECEDRDAPG